jgi:hypothetical protein
MTDTRKQRLETFLALHNANEPSNIALNTPLRLEIAAALAYPDGSMTASGLRREAGRGRLAIERVAGKDYTTLQAIEKMRELCRQQPKVRDCGSASPGGTRPDESRIAPSGSSSTEGIKRARSAAEMIVSGLKENLRPTSTASTAPQQRKRAPVIPIRSPLPTS